MTDRTITSRYVGEEFVTGSDVIADVTTADYYIAVTVHRQPDGSAMTAVNISENLDRLQLEALRVLINSAIDKAAAAKGDS